MTTADGRSFISAESQSIPSRGRNLPYPVSSGQQRIRFLEDLAGGMPLYNESQAVRLVGELRAEAMEEALNLIIARHDVLRTTIQAVGGRPIAVVHENWPLLMKRIDLGGLAPVQRDFEVERLLVDEPKHPFELEKEPGIRVTLVRLSQSEHVFILMMSHFICDHTSWGILWRELSSVYGAIARSEPIALDRLPIQYGDYAIWQQQRIDEMGFAEDLAFWEDNLRGAPELLELPSDRPRPRMQSYRGARQRFRLNTTLTEALRSCSRQEKTSLFTVFAAALNTLLYRYTGSADISLGIPVADRERTELQSVLGFLTQTHVLRTKLSADLTFRELIERVQIGMLALHSHSEVPFGQIVTMLQPERTLSYAPLFQVVLDWRDRDQHLSFVGLDGLVVESLLAETRTSKFDLTLSVTDFGAEICLEAEYNTDLFDHDRVARMVDHYQTLLKAAATRPDARLPELPLLNQADRTLLLEEWNATDVNYPQDLCVHQLFEQQVERTPEKLAVVYEERELSYSQLNARANQLARHLKKLGVKPDGRVAICVERGIEMVVGLLAVLKAGGAYVPLDPTYPVERLRYMVKDSAPTVLLTQSQFKGSFKGLSNFLPIIDLATDSPAWAEEPGTNQDCTGIGLTSAHLAYVIYTSGSTGTPKGVMIEHRGVCNYLLWAINSYGPTSAVVSSSLSFDATVTSLYVPLLCGSTTRLLPEREEIDGLNVQIGAHGHCGLVKITPSHLAALGQRVRSERRSSSVGIFVIGGEQLSASTLRMWRHIQSDIRLVNEYGPTETVVGCLAYDVPKNFSLSRPVPIGRPIANMRIYVLDRHGEPAPIGVPGEIYIGGVGVARGYLNQPELTIERFAKDPFVSDAGARMYKTGDLGRWLPEGTIEFLGRNDFQVKVRGYRIELGEIEVRLREHADVRESVVLAREDSPGNRRLVAYYTGGESVGAAELGRYLKEQLPEYMVPAAFVRLEAMPLTPNGKLDRKALPTPETNAYAVSLYEAPRGKIEQILAEIWGKIFGLKQIGVHDDFFALGGNSLLVTRLIAEVHKSFSQELSVAAFFQNPTIDGMAKRVQEEKQAASQYHLTKSRSSIVPIRPEGSGPPLFLLHGVGGRIFGFHALIRHLEPSQRIYGVEYVINDSAPVKLSLEDLAEQYIKEIRSVQAEGPYYLLGYSFGGLLAFEIAQQMCELGQEVGLLGMVDTLILNCVEGHDSRQSMIGTLKKMALALNSQARRVLRGPDRLDYIRDELSIKKGDLTARIRALVYKILTAGERALPKVLEQAYAVNWFAASRYRPRQYPGCVTLFRATSGDITAYEEYGGKLEWRSLAKGDVEVYEIAGTHHNIIREPNVKLLAQAVTYCLRLGRGQRPSPSYLSKPELSIVQTETSFETEPITTGVKCLWKQAINTKC
jgi:amino acid adenylation domain-containing protein